MADVELSYKGETIGSMSASGSLTLETAGKYCEDDIEVEYTKPSGPTPTGTKAITISGPGTTTEDVTNYANAEITVPAGSAATPATTVPVTPAISVSNSGLITASVNASQNVTPAVSPGFVSAGTAGAVSVSGSNTQQLTVYAGALRGA